MQSLIVTESHEGGTDNMANEIDTQNLGKMLKYKDREAYITKMKEELMERIGTAQAIILMGRTPKGEIRKRLMNPKYPKSEKNPEFSYLEHAYVEEVLNLAFSFNWDAIVEETTWTGDDVMLKGYIEIRFPKGGIVVKKSGFGGAKYLSNNPNMSRGDAAKSAYSDMIKNAATKFGIGLDLYRHEEVEQEKVQKIVQQAPSQPTDDTNGKPATEAQLDAIVRLGGQLPEDADEAKKITFGQAAIMIKDLSTKKAKAKPQTEAPSQ